MKPIISLLISSLIVSCSTVTGGQGITSTAEIQSEDITPSVEITKQITQTQIDKTKTPTERILTPTQGSGIRQEDSIAVKGLISLVSGLDDGVDIYTMDITCVETPSKCISALIQVIDNEHRDYFPLWSPDGSQILFLSDQAGSYFIFDLYLMNADGSEVTRLTYLPLSKDQPTWSPKGDAIAYVAKQDQAGSIYTYLLNERRVRPLPEQRDWSVWPAWSPDGQKIAFVSYDNGFNKPKDLCVMDSDGNNIECLTNDAYVAERIPSWSPDGDSILFSMKEEDKYIIYIVDLQTESFTRLTDGQNSATNPTWSPDGTRIAYTASIGDNLDIFIMKADGSDNRRITRDPAQDAMPIWSKDGKFVVFTSLRDGHPQVYVASSSGTWVKQLTRARFDLTAYSLFEGPEVE